MNAFLPKGWERHELGDVVTLKSGGTPNRATEVFWGGDVPWISAKDLKFFDLQDSIERLTSIGAAQVNIVPAETILILVRGMGLFKDFPIGITSREMTFNQDIKALIPRSKINSRFLAYALMAMRCAIMGRVDRAGHGTGRLPTDYLVALPIAFPPLGAQKRIVTALDAWGQAIDQVERLIAAKRRRYRGLLHKLIGPAFVDQQSNSWVPHKLGQVFTEREDRSADLPLLAITGGGGVVPREELDRRQTASEDKSKYKVIIPGDIGYNTMRMWQGVFGRSGHTGIVSPAYTVVTAIDGIVDPVFASHLFAHPKAISLFHRYSQGLVDDTLMLKYPQFSEISMRLPNIAEQQEIGEILEGEEADLRPQDQHLASLRTQKRGLMQKLLTGKWPLDERFDPPAIATLEQLSKNQEVRASHVS